MLPIKVMMNPRGYFLLGQTILGACLVVCLMLIPGYFFSHDQGGVSNYGTDERTIALFTIGFTAAAAGSLLAGLSLPSSFLQRRRKQLGLFLLALFYTAVLVSTFSYKVSDSLRSIHEYSALALFGVMLAQALWLALKVNPRDSRTRRALTIFLAAFVAGLLTVFGPLHILFTVQIVCGVTFGYIWVRAFEAQHPRALENQPL